MKQCFGVGLGAFFEEGVERLNTREECHGCEDFDRCFRAMLIKQLIGIRTEIKQGVRGIRNSLGGSHREFPFG
ncbi:MAG: hypothetical protein HUU25_01585 [Candidatus Sumerlaeia bacterium]|nr:hypothetical protein [Candidatus Sumerlaeia bacterium]